MTYCFVPPSAESFLSLYACIHPFFSYKVKGKGGKGGKGRERKGKNTNVIVKIIFPVCLFNFKIFLSGLLFVSFTQSSSDFQNFCNQVLLIHLLHYGTEKLTLLTPLPRKCYLCFFASMLFSQKSLFSHVITQV